MLGFRLTKWVYVAFFVTGILVTWFILNGRPDPVAKPLPTSPTPIVETLPLISGANVLVVRTQGVVEPAIQIQLVAQVSGRISSVNDRFKPGGWFDLNEPLVVVESSDYEIAVSQARSRLADAHQVFAKEQGASRQAKREWRDLGSQDANDLFLRKPQLASAKAMVDAAKAGVRKAKLDLSRTEISAPFKGAVLQKHVDIGQFVSVGSPIAEIFDSGQAEIRLPLTLPQRYQLDTTGNNQVVLYTYINHQRFEWIGEFLRMEASVDRNSRQIFAVVGIENAFSTATTTIIDSAAVSTISSSVPDQFPLEDALPREAISPVPLSVGQFLQAEIKGKVVENTFDIPRAALRQASQIWIVDNDKKLNVLNVRVLQSDEHHAIVDIDSINQFKHPLYVVISDLALAIPGTVVELAHEN